MKLYTEEQVRKIFETLSNNTGYDYSMEDYIFHESLTPIEIPSDEEIKKQMSLIKTGWGQMIYDAGAKWMRNQILGQNK